MRDFFFRVEGLRRTGTSCCPFSTSSSGGKHWDALQNPQQYSENAFVNHASYYHWDRELDKVDYRLNLLYTCNKAMERQSSEGVEIRHREQDVDIINSKFDHYALHVGRMVLEKEVAGRGRGARRRGH